MVYKLSFFRKLFTKSKTKQVRADSDLALQERVRQKTETPEDTTPLVRTRGGITLKDQTILLEKKLNQPDTRQNPPKHIEIIRALAANYLKLGNLEDFEYFGKADNLYKQMNVLYPLHMEKIDWLTWIEASAKAKLIREARRLLTEARLLFPGDEDLDRIETTVLHITEAETTG
jgi:hypothetical protein